MSARGRAYARALKELASRVAALELVPCRSPSFGSRALIRRLRSTQAVKRFVHGELFKEAEAGRVTIVVLRRPDAWGFRQADARSLVRKNIIIYPTRLARAASLGPRSKGGRAILERLLSQPRAR